MFSWMMATAMAGTVYVNGVDVGALRNQTFENASVTIDAKGDVYIKAPGYRIEVVDPQPAPQPQVRTMQPVQPAQPVQTASVRTAPPVQPVQPMTPQQQSGVAAGRYWLVSEDSGSRGHTIDVSVNGNRVLTVRSGDSQKIVDLSKWLRLGSNTIRVDSDSVAAGGGPLYVYVGSGDNNTGTVVLNTPEIQFGLGASRHGQQSKEYTLTVH